MPEPFYCWKIRFVKPYPEAHNHLVIGYVLEQDEIKVKVRGRTFHYGKIVALSQGTLDASTIAVGSFSDRIIPWSRIEIVNILPNDFDVQMAKLENRPNEIVFTDGDNYATITQQFANY